MGLDMYLTGKRYVSSYADEDKEISSGIVGLLDELEDFGTDAVEEISIRAGYWRKANQIHEWFVKNVQGGEDECKPHWVSREQLIELQSLCHQVLGDHSRAAELLPRQAGFFFGAQEYDQWYFQDLKDTIAIVDKCLQLPVHWKFEYCSSW